MRNKNIKYENLTVEVEDIIYWDLKPNPELSDQFENINKCDVFFIKKHKDFLKERQ